MDCLSRVDWRTEYSERCVALTWQDIVMAEALTPVEQAVDTLDRLRRHLDAIRKGEATARDDLAVVLHLLVGAGDGYGVIQNAVDYLGVSPPDLAVWGTEVPIQIDGAPVTLAIRSARHDEDAAVLSFPDALQEVCLRFAIPGVAPEANWSWEAVIRKVRNKFGGHLDGKPPVWLQDLRYYPVADTDAVTFLLWSIGEAILSATTHHLCDHGVDVVVFQPEDKYLNGISFEQGYVIQESETKLDVQAQLACERWASGRRRAVLGGRFADRPFIFGIEGDARLTL